MCLEEGSYSSPLPVLWYPIRVNQHHWTTQPNETGWVLIHTPGCFVHPGLCIQHYLAEHFQFLCTYRFCFCDVLNINICFCVCDYVHFCPANRYTQYSPTQFLQVYKDVQVWQCVGLFLYVNIITLNNSFVIIWNAWMCDSACIFFLLPSLTSKQIITEMFNSAKFNTLHLHCTIEMASIFSMFWWMDVSGIIPVCVFNL